MKRRLGTSEQKIRPRGACTVGAILGQGEWCLLSAAAVEQARAGAFLGEGVVVTEVLLPTDAEIVAHLLVNEPPDIIVRVERFAVTAVLPFRD